MMIIQGGVMGSKKEILLISEPEIRMWVSISVMVTLMLIEAGGDREKVMGAK